MNRIFVGVDGSNLTIQYNRDREKIATRKRFEGIQQYCAGLVEAYPSVQPIVFVDYGILRLSDDPLWLREQINTWQIFQCEQGLKADEYLIELLTVAPMCALVVSNDKLRDYHDIIPSMYSRTKWRFDAYFENNKLKVPDLEYRIEHILGFEEFGHANIYKSLSKELIREYLEGF